MVTFEEWMRLKKDESIFSNLGKYSKAALATAPKALSQVVGNIVGVPDLPFDPIDTIAQGAKSLFSHPNVQSTLKNQGIVPLTSQEAHVLNVKCKNKSEWDACNILCNHRYSYACSKVGKRKIGRRWISNPLAR
jgi:hypothetical protein